jgi:hypothetical protein
MLEVKPADVVRKLAICAREHVLVHMQQIPRGSLNKHWKISSGG